MLHHIVFLLMLSIGRALEMMESLANKEDGEDYKTFWEAFGRNLKVCICTSVKMRFALNFKKKANAFKCFM
jgi:HSP90 family molecular chaperone